MKKVILALAIVSVTFAACNDSKTSETTSDTTTVVTPVAADTVKVVTDTTITVDTLKK